MSDAERKQKTKDALSKLRMRLAEIKKNRVEIFKKEIVEKDKKAAEDLRKKI